MNYSELKKLKNFYSNPAHHPIICFFPNFTSLFISLKLINKKNMKVIGENWISIVTLFGRFEREWGLTNHGMSFDKDGTSIATIEKKVQANCFIFC